MSWSILQDVPNPHIDLNGDPYAGAVLKAYLPGTTTSTSIAIDSSGSSPQASLTYNAEGKLEVSGNEILPYIDRKCKWGIFANSTDAAANTPFQMGPFDDVEKILDSAVDVITSKTLAEAIADTGAQDGLNPVMISDRGNGIFDYALSSSVTENTYDIIQCTGVGTLSLVLRVNGEVSIAELGAIAGNDSNDSTDAIQRGIDAGYSLTAPSGTFAVTSLTPRTGTRFRGQGRDKTILKQVLLTSPGGRFSLWEPADTYSDVEISDIGLDGNYTANNAAGRYSGQSGDGAINGIRMSNLDNARFHDIDIKDFFTDGVYWAKINDANKVTPTNCSLYNFRITARRNGIVITLADGFTIRNGLIYDVGVVSPFSAIDIEPFEDAIVSNGIIDNLEIVNCVRGIGAVTKAPGTLGYTYGSNLIISNILMRSITGEQAITVHGINDVQISNIIIDHSVPSGLTNSSSILIGQTRRTTVSDVHILNSDFAGVRVLDAFVGDVNHVDTIVSLENIFVTNPRRHGIAIGGESGTVAGNQIDAKLLNLTVTSGSNTDGTGHGILLGDINPNFISLAQCSETSTDFMFSFYMSYTSTVFLPLFGCDLETVFVTNDVDSVNGITQANPAVVTATGHSFTNGESVLIKDVSGMTEINGTVAVVANTTANTFELAGVDSTSFTAYTSGGLINTSQSVFSHLALAATTLRALMGTNNPGFGGRIATFNDSGNETVRIDGNNAAVRYLSETVLADTQNNSIFVSSVDSKLKWRDDSGVEQDLY